jgi:hypothetical protein
MHKSAASHLDDEAPGGALPSDDLSGGLAFLLAELDIESIGPGVPRLSWPESCFQHLKMQSQPLLRTQPNIHFRYPRQLTSSSLDRTPSSGIIVVSLYMGSCLNASPYLLHSILPTKTGLSSILYEILVQLSILYEDRPCQPRPLGLAHANCISV